MIKAKVEIIGFEEGVDWDEIVDEIDDCLSIPSLSDLEGDDYNSYFSNAATDNIRLIKNLTIKMVTFYCVKDDDETEYYEGAMFNNFEDVMGCDVRNYEEYQSLFRDITEGEYKMNLHWVSKFDNPFVEYQSMEKL